LIVFNRFYLQRYDQLAATIKSTGALESIKLDIDLQLKRAHEDVAAGFQFFADALNAKDQPGMTIT